VPPSLNSDSVLTRNSQATGWVTTELEGYEESKVVGATCRTTAASHEPSRDSPKCHLAKVGASGLW
jgi:hypothetical protein